MFTLARWTLFFLHMHLRFWLISYPPKYTKTKFKVYFNRKPSHFPLFKRFFIHIDRTSDLIDCTFANWILSMSLKDCSCHKIHLWNVWEKKRVRNDFLKLTLRYIANKRVYDYLIHTCRLCTQVYSPNRCPFPCNSSDNWHLSNSLFRSTTQC